MKDCTLCGVSLSLDEFGPHVKAKDGKQSRCRACLREGKRVRRVELKARSKAELEQAFAAAPCLKLCPVCKTEKPKELFSRDAGKPNAIGQYCLACVSVKTAMHRAQNPESVKASQRLSYAKNYESRTRPYILLKNFNFSADAYEALLDKQNGLCAICFMPPSGRVKWLCVDHNHTTGEIRGLLCNHCNRAIGLLRDDPQIAANAADYLAIADLISGLSVRNNS